jgi:hypothetical protein
MKTKSFLALLLLTVLFKTNLCYSQNNIYFQHNPVWREYYACGLDYPCIYENNYNYYVNGELLVDTVVYAQIYYKGHWSYYWAGPPPAGSCVSSGDYVNPDPDYYLRSENKKMFLYEPGTMTEYLLYDFTLSINDTLPLTYNNNASDIFVTAIDSIYTPYGYRKRFTLGGNTPSQYLIEGIGHSGGLIAPLNPAFECGNANLNCFSLNDTAYYPIIGPTCNLTVGVNSQNQKLSATIFPNPFSTSTILETNKMLHGATLTVYSSYGQQVRQINNIIGKSIQLQRENLLSGLYFVQLIQDNKIISSDKLVITD